MSHNVLQVIAHYNMTKQEATAYKVACMYEHLLEKLCPKMRRCTLGKGDPRKKEVFKYAWKLTTDPKFRELDPSDYKLYVLAQLKVFKTYLDQGREVFIHPGCLTSDKAWNRWLMVKKKYEQRKQFQTVEQAGVKVNSDDKVQTALAADKAYFQKRFGRLDAKDILDALDSGSLRRWVGLTHVSGYYPYLSPLVTSWLSQKKVTIRDYFGSALNVYSGGVTPAIQSYFQEEFKHEYGRREE